MASWMLYATLVSVLSGAAAWSLERTAHGLPLRWIWVVALGASCTVPHLGRVQTPTSTLGPAAGDVLTVGAEEPPLPAADLEPRSLTAAKPGELRWVSPPLPGHLDGWAGVLWALLSLSVGAGVLRSGVVLRSARRTWTAERVDGREVLVSEDVGPAVVGVLRPAIVVPRWVMNAPALDRALILRHEEEHVHARDPQLLLAALGLVVLLPWNVPLWWQARRLRMAVEVDCDRRVLRGSGELRRYAALLVEVGRRGALARLRAVGLMDQLPFLERRIRTMTHGADQKRAATAALALSACVLAIGALQLKAPVLGEAGSPDPATPVATHLAEAPAVQGAPQAPAHSSTAPDPAVPAARAPVAAPAPRSAAGSVSGRVTDARSGAPLQSVQVYLMNVSLGTLTGPNGSFVIAEVPAGTYQLRAERIGLTTGSVEITVVDGGVAEVNFELRAQSIGVDEIRSLRPGEVPGAPVPASADPTPERPGNVPVGAPLFTPFSVRPRVANVVEVQESLTREYPPALRDAGIGGSVFVNLFVGEDGTVRNLVIQRSSGNDALDEAALRVARGMLFSPAMNRDQIVAVWVTLPLTFR